MEFQYSNYTVTVVFNPSDTIIRFEHKQTYRAYEQTFFERDFPIAVGLGGMEFVGKILVAALKASDSSMSILLEESTTHLELKVSYTTPFFVKPIELVFHLPAVRKESGKADVTTLQRKMKELSESIEPRVQSLQETMESRLKKLETLVPLVQELQDRCGSSLTIPGCIFAIPTNMTSLILIRNQTSLPDGRAFSSMMPGYNTMAQFSNCALNWQQMFIGHNHLGYSVLWAPCADSFVYDKLTSISNLKYLKQCKQLTLSGCSDLTDYSPLGEMTWLTHLTIVSSRQFTSGGNPIVYGNMGNNPVLKDLTWISNLKNLESLTLLGCSHLSDITPLKDLPKLKTLDIRETAVRNTSFLTTGGLTIAVH